MRLRGRETEKSNIKTKLKQHKTPAGSALKCPARVQDARSAKLEHFFCFTVTSRLHLVLSVCIKPSLVSC